MKAVKSYFCIIHRQILKIPFNQQQNFLIKTYLIKNLVLKQNLKNI